MLTEEEVSEFPFLPPDCDEVPNIIDTTNTNGLQVRRKIDSNTTLFPNPSSSFCTISSSDYIKDIIVRDSRGTTLICPVDISDKECIFDIGHLPNGLYFVTVQYSAYTEVLKFIKL